MNIQGEEITLSSDVDMYVIQIKNAKTILVQVYTEDGVLKNVKVRFNTILPNGKTLLKKGDVVKYIAIF